MDVMFDAGQCAVAFAHNRIAGESAFLVHQVSDVPFSLSRTEPSLLMHAAR